MFAGFGRRPPSTDRRHQHRGLALLVVAFGSVIGLLAIEVAIRLHHLGEGRSFWRDTPYLVTDDRLGWRAAPDLRLASGRGVYSTDRLGFRRAPPADAPGPRLVFLGDSFTHAVEVADHEGYWARFAERVPDHAVYAIGAGGYGTLQQLLLLTEVAPVVRPAIVIWQFCANDLVNNLLAAERTSPRHNSRMRRPYLVGTQIAYADPAPTLSRVLDQGYRLTGLRALKVLDGRLYRLGGQLAGAAVEPDETTRAPGARAVTGRILTTAREHFPTVRFLGFSLCGDAAADAIFAEVSGAAGFGFLGGFAAAVRAAAPPGVDIFAADGRHYNATGHRILGDLLSEAFRTVTRRDGSLSATAVP